MPSPQISTLSFNKIYTYADYLTWELKERIELIKGKLFKMSPAPSLEHQSISANLFGELYVYLKKKKCKIFTAPFDVRLLDQQKSIENTAIYTVVQPDICVICDTSKLDQRGCLGAPDLIIEILSPSTATKDLKDKFQIYEENKVSEYWVVFPGEQVVQVFELNEKVSYQLKKSYTREDQIDSKCLPGFKLDLKEVFETLTD